MDIVAFIMKIILYLTHILNFSMLLFFLYFIVQKMYTGAIFALLMFIMVYRIMLISERIQYNFIYMLFIMFLLSGIRDLIEEYNQTIE